MKDEKFDPKFLVTKAFKYWYLFALLLPLCLVMAYLYLKSSPAVYQANASVLIKDEEDSGQLSAAQLFQDLGLTPNTKKLENEIAILSSTPLMLKAVRDQNLNYEYILEGSLAKKHLYQNSPVEVYRWQPAGPDSSFVGRVDFLASGKFNLTYEKADGNEVTQTGTFGKPVLLEEGMLTLRQKGSVYADHTILLRISSMYGMAKELQSNLTVSPAGEESSVLQLSIKDVIPERAHDVLSHLIRNYNENSIQLENEVFRNTLDLISDRIVLINGELNDAEKELEYYKQSNGTVALSTEGEMLLTELTSYNEEIKQVDVRLAILESIEDFLVTKKESFEFVPTNLELNNLTLTTQLTSFNELLIRRQSMENNLGPNHPDLALVTSQINNLRENIVQSISSIKADLQIGRQANLNERDRIERRLQSLPTRERELIQRERNKGVMENLYLYLLQKREETAISMAVTTSVGLVIEPPIVPKDPISPRKMQVWLIGLFFGLALPSGLLVLILQLNNKIHSAEELAHYSSVPLLGTLAKGDSDDSLVFHDGELTAQGEMFRMLRANLSFILPEQRLKTLLITSAIPGEGKSYTALNLAMVHALANKRVLLMKLDLRKPYEVEKDLPQLLKSEKVPGMVDYLIKPEMRADEIIQNSGIHRNLDIVPPGSKAPNPGELVLSSRLREFVDKARDIYDLIIIDSPPVSLVADAIQMKDIAEATLFIARVEHTAQNNVDFINALVANEIFPRPYFVLNGVRVGKYLYKGYYKAYRLRKSKASTRV